MLASKGIKNRLIVISIVLLIIVYIFVQVNVTKTKYVKVTTKKYLPVNGIKILQISDFHDKKVFKNYPIKQLKKLSPDIVVLTGDLMDEKTKDISNVLDFIGKLVKIHPNIYFVNGNHDWRTGKVNELVSKLKDLGIKVLNNRNEILTIRGIKINLCGVDDYYTHRSNFKSSLKGIDNSKYTVLLSHSPDIVLTQRNLSIDLILSGHTHGGQIRLPFIGAIVSPGQGFFPKYNKGLYEIYNSTMLYIDSGIGTSKLPIRFLNRSQISLITIAKK